MPDGTVTIRCPYCGHPYPMTPIQIDVYRGRNMGCMACGKPFEVKQPPPPPPPAPLVAGELTSAPAGVLPGAPLPGGQSAESQPLAAASVQPVPSGGTSLSSPASHSPPTWLDRSAVGAAVLFVVLVMAAAIAGYSAS